MDDMMHELTRERLQLDEIWAYVGMKQKTASRLGKTEGYGDLYTFVAIDADTKLVPSWHVGRRSWNDTTEFVADLRSRITNRPQITSDAFAAYYGAISSAFENRVDYSQIHKVFASELNTGRGRYSPPTMVRCEQDHLIGQPDPAHSSTSYIERQNLTMRMSMRRFTRLTNGFSKKRENLVAAVCLHFAHYNLVRIHKTLRMTPAMAHGISDHIWTIEELIESASN
jgi:IS1 family transposase